jgi:hypothetical protein
MSRLGDGDEHEDASDDRRRARLNLANKSRRRTSNEMQVGIWSYGQYSTLPRHFPVATVILKTDSLSIGEAGNGETFVMDDGLLKQIREVESAMICQCIPAIHQEAIDRAASGQSIRLAFDDTIPHVSINGKMSQSLQPHRIDTNCDCYLQLVGRMMNVWGYEDENGCYRCGLVWEVDRVYRDLTAKPPPILVPRPNGHQS